MPDSNLSWDPETHEAAFVLIVGLAFIGMLMILIFSLVMLIGGEILKFFGLM